MFDGGDSPAAAVTVDARMVQTEHKPQAQVEARPAPSDAAEAAPAAAVNGMPPGSPEGQAAAPRGAQAQPTGAAIELRGVGKCYQIYAKPADRLKQALWRHTRKFYREFWALRDLDLTVPRGETLGVIGRNGAGKSTLVQMIAGTLSPTVGTIRAEGKVSALLELGAGFNQEFTGRENIYLAGSIRGLTRKEINQKFDDIVDFADIGDFLDQPVKTYSSGMYVRLAFAVAAQMRPEILVVDEALAVGDIFFKQRCHKFMREDLKGVTKLLVTHDLNTVANHCDRAIVLHKGRMVFEGTPRDAIACYTKIIHTEKFSGQSGPKAKRGKQADADEFRGANSADGVAAGDLLPWIDVPDDKRGGAGEVTIRRVAVADADGEAIQTMEPDDGYSCYFDIEVAAPKENLLFGVTVIDRFGRAACGDNSLSLKHGSIDCAEPGRYVVQADFIWPEIQPGEYTMTFGVGEGTHAHHHTVQSWAHNILAVQAISPRRAVHGLFTNPMKDVRITRVG